MLNTYNNQGFSYPFSLNGKLGISQGQNYIREGIRSRIDTYFFELLMEPRGCKLRDLLFDALDEVFVDSARIFIADALRDYTLINLLGVQVRIQDNEALITITYRNTQDSDTDTFNFQLPQLSGTI